MDPENPMSGNPLPANIIPQEKPAFYKNKKYIFIFLAVVFCVILGLGAVYFFSTQKEEPENNITTIPTSSPKKQNKSWKVEILYTPSTGKISVESITLEDTLAEGSSNADSPYIVEVLDKENSVLHSQKIIVPTGLIIPEFLKNSTISASLSQQPLYTSFTVPYFEKGSVMVIKNSGNVITSLEFPQNIHSQVSSVQAMPSDTFSSVPVSISSIESSSPNGWKLSVEAVCEDGKAIAKYQYTIPDFFGAIFTFDGDVPVGGSGSMADSSWGMGAKEGESKIALIPAGSGEYIARGNMTEKLSVSRGAITYNTPHGLEKGKSYMGELVLSGDWYCNVIGDTSRPGCVQGPGPTNEYIAQARTSVTFKTPTVAECPDIPLTSAPTSGAPISHPENPSSQKNQITCIPDPSCSNKQNALQVCQLICS